MLDLNSIYGEPNSIVTPFLRSFMGTFQVGIRNRGAKSSALHNLMVVAMDREQAAEVAQDIIEPYDMIVKDVTSPGEELYGLGAGIDADPINQKRYRIDEGFGL